MKKGRPKKTSYAKCSNCSAEAYCKGRCHSCYNFFRNHNIDRDPSLELKRGRRAKVNRPKPAKAIESIPTKTVIPRKKHKDIVGNQPPNPYKPSYLTCEACLSAYRNWLAGEKE